MRLLENNGYEVERAVLNDAIKFENGQIVLDAADAAVVHIADEYKCVFKSADAAKRYIKELGIRGLVCIMGIPIGESADAFNADECRTFAYLRPLPPPLNGFDIRRLAPTLAGVVSEKYRNRGHGLTVPEAQELMRERGVFGAFTDSKFAGFIGRHGDGSMGMLTVFEEYRHMGFGAALETFMINYVMSFLRVPHCDVYSDNAPSIKLQHKLGLTESKNATFWTEING